MPHALRTTRLLVCMALAWQAAAGASSADQAESASRAYKMAPVTVTGETEHADGPITEDVRGTSIYAGKKASVINLDERPTIVNNNFRQTLAKTPGLLLSEESTPLFSVGYRGLDPHRAQFMQVLADGVPIHAEMFGYPEAYYVPALPTIERIEFLHGGGSLMYGPQPGGTLNFITKRPQAGTPFAVSTEHSVGSDQLVSTYTSLGGQQAPLGYAGYLHEREGNGFRDANSDFEVVGGGVKATHGHDTDSRWLVAYDEYHEEHGEPGGLTKVVTDGEGRDLVTRPNDRFRLERYYGTLIYERELSDATQVDFRTFGGHYRRFSKRQAGGGFGTLATGGTNSVEEQDFYTFGVEPRIRHAYDAFGETGHAVTAGVLAYISDSPRQDHTGANPAADTGTLTAKSDRQMQYLSLFTEHLFRFGDFSVTPGVRLEHIWQQVKEQVNTSKTTVPLGDISEFDFVPLVGVGAEYAAGRGVEVYSNLSQAYRPKVFTQAVPTGALQVLNNDLEEGKSWMFDVGARGEHGGFANWDASYFYLDFEDQIGTAGNTIDNVGDARHQGVELGVDVDLIGAWDAAQGTGHRDQVGGFGPYLNVTLLDAKFTDGPQSGKTPAYAPQYTVRVGAQYAFQERARVALQSTFVDDHFADDSNLATRTVPSYKVWDLTGEVQVWKDHVTLIGGVNNLFNERYYARIRSDGIDPAYERNVYGGVRVGFRY